MLVSMFLCRKAFRKLTQLLLEEKIVDYTVVDPIDYEDNKQKNSIILIYLLKQKNAIYVTIKTGSSDDKQNLYKSHYEFYKKLRDNHVNSLYINFIYGEDDKDYTIQKINADFGDSDYLFEIVDFNMDKLAFNYHELNDAPTKEELEFLKEIGSKYVYNKKTSEEK